MEQSFEKIKNLMDKIYLTGSQSRIHWQITAVLWCLDCPKSFQDNLKKIANARIISSNYRQLSNISYFLSNLPSGYHDESMVLFLSSEVTINGDLFQFLTSRMDEHEINHDETNILTAVGFKIFPHDKCTKPDLFAEGIHWKRYSELSTDREVHIFSFEFSMIPLCILIKIEKLQDNVPVHDNCIWLSFLMSYKMNPPVHIWKVNTTEVLSFSENRIKDIKCLVSDETNDSFHILYSKLYDAGWPNGVSDRMKFSEVSSTCMASCSSLWDKGFGGVNMAIHPASELDYEAAAAYGIKVIRIGAVADAKDLSYLLDPKSKSIEQDEIHLQKVLPRLRAALIKAGSNGLRMIITMVDLPGCSFHSGSCKEFWESNECRQRIVKFWSVLAKNLHDLRDIIMGYDIINEPYTTEDNACDYFDDMPMAHADVLNEFYSEVVKEIRKIDPHIAILLKGLWFSSPRKFQVLRPINDKNVYYGFHAYIPPLLCLARILNASPSSYPGLVQKWVHNKDETILINTDTLRQLLIDTVYSWQVKNNIHPRQIIVAEFGICREVEGASSYLSDLIKIFEEFKWSWLLFSFRDEEWDALDYELGTDMSNMLHHSSTDLFHVVAKHFH